MKKVMPFILAGSAIVFAACSEPEDYSDDGRKAAGEFCACYEENTKEECLDALKDKYESYRYLSEEFIDAFNETSTCDIELIIEQEKSASSGRGENKKRIYSASLIREDTLSL